MIRLFVSLAIMLALGRPGRATELTNADAVLTFALQQGASYDSFTADFTQSVQMMGHWAKSTGVYQFKKPSQTRLEMNHTVMGRTQLVHAVMGNDQVVWQELDGGKNVLKLDLKTIPANHPAAALLQNPFETIDPQRFIAQVKSDYTETLTGTAALHDQPMYILEGTRRADATWSPAAKARMRGWGKHRLAIGQRDGFLHHVKQFDTTGTNVVMALEFTALRFNGTMTDRLFQYQPSPDANVIDMTTVLLRQLGTKQSPSRK
jgi:outer membrane lipoprotein-sorting protein